MYYNITASCLSFGSAFGDTCSSRSGNTQLLLHQQFKAFPRYSIFYIRLCINNLNIFYYYCYLLFSWYENAPQNCAYDAKSNSSNNLWFKTTHDLNLEYTNQVQTALTEGFEKFPRSEDTLLTMAGVSAISTMLQQQQRGRIRGLNPVEEGTRIRQTDRRGSERGGGSRGRVWLGQGLGRW